MISINLHQMWQFIFKAQNNDWPFLPKSGLGKHLKSYFKRYQWPHWKIYFELTGHCFIIRLIAVFFILSLRRWNSRKFNVYCHTTMNICFAIDFAWMFNMIFFNQLGFYKNGWNRELDVKLHRFQNPNKRKTRKYYIYII